MGPSTTYSVGQPWAEGAPSMRPQRRNMPERIPNSGVGQFRAPENTTAKIITIAKNNIGFKLPAS